MFRVPSSIFGSGTLRLNVSDLTLHFGIYLLSVMRPGLITREFFNERDGGGRLSFSIEHFEVRSHFYVFDINHLLSMLFALSLLFPIFISFSPFPSHLFSFVLFRFLSFLHPVSEVKKVLAILLMMHVFFFSIWLLILRKALSKSKDDEYFSNLMRFYYLSS